MRARACIAKHGRTALLGLGAGVLAAGVLLPGAPAGAQGVTGGTPSSTVLDAARTQTLSGGTEAPSTATAAGGSEYGIVSKPPRVHKKPVRPVQRRTGRRAPVKPARPPQHRHTASKPKPPVKPPVVPPPSAVVAPVLGAPTPSQTAPGAVFPVRGAHSYGDAANRFGAARSGHVHEGQDVLAAEGVAVVAPLAGTIATTAYQAGGAGYYAVEHAADGLDLMFAHCEAGSFAVAAGQTVSAGQALCRVGQTGDATAPHLHFEIWVGGWQARGGQPIDPLAYLQAWEGSGG